MDEMYSFFEGLINDAINNAGELPGNWTVWSETFGWLVIDPDTGNEIEISIKEV